MATEYKNSASGRKIWIAAGLVAGVVAVGLVALDYPPSPEGASGTIVPAKRFRADEAGVPTVAAPMGDATQSSASASMMADDIGANAAADSALNRAAADSALNRAVADSAANRAVADSAANRAVADSAANRAVADSAANRAVADQASNR
jgi:hypothetical protein